MWNGDKVPVRTNLRARIWSKSLLGAVVGFLSLPGVRRSRNWSLNLGMGDRRGLVYRTMLGAGAFGGVRGD